MPDQMARFWAAALDYDLEGPPDGFESWRSYWLSLGVPEDEVEGGFDSVVDPAGVGPRIWFQQVPEAKAVKNRWHLDVLAGGGRTSPLDIRRARVEAEAARLVGIGASIIKANDLPEHDHFAIAMRDPEGNEFDVV
jgi:hypothetical protein